METETKEIAHFDADRNPIKVLLVEDDAVDARLVERILAQSSKPVKFAVESVGSLSAAIDCLSSKKYDTVLLDLELPDSSGIETVQKIKQVIPNTLVVVLTGINDEEMGPLAIRSGASDYLAKNLPLNALLVRTIIYALERNKKEKLLIETNHQLQESTQKLLNAKEELEEKNQALEKAREELEKRVEQRTMELARANKTLQATEANLRNMIKQNADGIVIVDSNGIVRFVNPAASSLFNRKPEELIGELFGFPVAAGQPTEIEIVRRDRKPITAEMHTAEIEWEEKSVNLVSIRDITERKLAEENLRKANEKLREYNQLKDEFVSTASHELRTPLSIIMGAIRLILDEIPGKIVAEQRDVLTTAMESVNRLTRIVDSLLTVSKIESGKLDLHKMVVNIGELIKDTVSNYKPLAQEKNLSLDFEVPEEGIAICVDSDRIKEVIINLISNSMKFTPEQGCIKVTCKRLGEEVQLSVHDSGIGIAKDDIPRLFDKFTQFGRKAGPGEKGTGLGLAIVKKLVDMHNGRIEVESELDKGTAFTITLPLTTEVPAENLPAETDELVETTLTNN